MTTILQRYAQIAVALSVFAGIPGSWTARADFVLVKDGKAQAQLVLAEDATESEKLAAEEIQTHIQAMSGAELAVANSAASGKMVNVFIGSAAPEPALDSFREGGNPAGFRLHVTPRRVQLVGVAPEGTLNAAYELLEQLGVRWYMPGDIGTVIPRHKTVSLREQDTVQHPGFLGRHLQAVQALVWRRRMRMGGIDTGTHSLGPKFDSEKEPDLFMQKDGKPTNQENVGHPEVLERTVKYWMKRLDANPNMTMIAVGPHDGGGFGNHPWDAGDMDPLHGKISVTDRYIKFFNAVLDRVHEKYPDVGLGFYAYAQYMRPPIRETPDPHILPMLAPIDLCRIHTVDSPHCWERQYMAKIIDGWQATGVQMMYRGYIFNLCNPGIPYSMTRQMAVEIPYFKEKGIIGCRIQAMPAWAFDGPSLYLAAKLMWDPGLDADALLDEYTTTFYGPGGVHVRRYFAMLEAAYLDADYHTGNVFDVPHLLTPEVMTELDRALDRAESAVPGDGIYAERLRMLRDGFHAGELILGTMNALNRCDFGTARKHADEARMLLKSGMEMTPPRFHKSVGIGYFNRFWANTVDHGYTCTHGDNEKLLQLPDEWHFMLDPYEAGEEMGLPSPHLKNQSWRTIRTYSDSWSNQGLRYYKGDCWYRTTFKAPAVPHGRDVVLWLGGVDNDPRVWLNGTELEMTKKGASPIGRPWEFLATEVFHPERENTIVIRVRNDRLRELGTGGLTGPAMFYAKPKS